MSDPSHGSDTTPVSAAASAPAQVQRSAAQLADSAEAMEESTRDLSDSADRRTVLAASRTVLAAERTYASWVRTALTSLASGVGARALLEEVVPVWLAQLTGSVLILFAVFCLIAAVWRQHHEGLPPPVPDVKPIPPLLLIVLNGFLGLVALSALVGVWAA
jgi:putative membrane protein